MEKSHLKMYILVRDAIERGLAINGAAHASLATYLEFQDHPDTQEWLARSFKKVVCLVTDEQLEICKKQADDFVVMTEDTIDNEVVAVGFRPRKRWPRSFKYLTMMR